MAKAFTSTQCRVISLLLSYTSTRRALMQCRSPWHPTSLKEVNSLYLRGSKTLSRAPLTLCPFTLKKVDPFIGC